MPKQLKQLKSKLIVVAFGIERRKGNEQNKIHENEDRRNNAKNRHSKQHKQKKNENGN